MALKLETDPFLPWPECLGVFDEESCRYFLRELGQRMVQFYPFSVGIEEVYSQIVDEYGLDGAADAISVLQELLEDESTAAGSGDDGDIWRSWRHSWRHRNVNSGNPYIPRVRGQILPPATSIRVRLLKNANFVTRQLNQAKEHAQDLSSPSSRSNDLLENSPGDPPENSQLDAKNASEEEHLLSSRTYDATSSNSAGPHSPQKCVAQLSRKYTFPFNLVSPRRRSGALSPRDNRSGWSGVNAIPEEEDSDLAAVEAVLVNDRLVRNNAPHSCDLGTKQTPSSAHAGSERTNRYSLPSDIGTTSPEATPTRRRASHRQARMIDGALFQGNTRKDGVVKTDSVDAASPAKQNDANKHERLSDHSTKQFTRGSWLRNVWTRFHGEKRRNSAHLKLRKQHSSLTSCGLISSQPSGRSTYFQPESSKIKEMAQTTPTQRLGFDGTCEEHLNKPLPLSPGDLHRPSIQSDIHRTFFGRNPKAVLLSSQASGSPASQQRFTTQKDVDLSSLVSATMSGPHELSPREKSWKYRFSDLSLKSEPSSPCSFTAIAKTNPYDSSNESSALTALVPPPPLTVQKEKISSIEWPFRAPLESQCQGTLDVAQANYQRMSSPRTEFEPCEKEAQRIQETGEYRGRRLSTPMRSAILQDSRFQTSPPKTPPPRSRSPVKRLIGMVKSMSTNQISDNVESPMQDSSASASKRKWKEISNKLRHGFLTADLEQLEQEEMMEQYSSNGDVQSLTPPPSRRRAAFPVSIKSSGQSKLWSELEYMLIETCNSFLKDELEHGRLSRESIIRAKRQWQARNRPQIIEFYYDQATQYEIITGNLRTIKLYSDYAEDAIMLNSVLHQWKILIREISVKTLCMPDSIVRRWLHDGRRVLELLGAPQITLAHLDRLSGLCFAVFGSAEKQRAKQRSRADTANSHRRSASDGSQNTLVIHEQALMNHGLSGALQAPPLPTNRSMGNAARKVTPQEQRIAHQARKSTERDRPNFTNAGRSFSKSLTSADERGRFAFD